MVEDILVPIGAFALAFGIIYIIFSTRHRERMNMIEKGIDPKSFIRPPRENNDGLIKWGLLMAGLGLGFYVGNLMDTYTALDDAPAYFGSVILFGGLGLILAYLLTRHNKKA